MRKRTARETRETRESALGSGWIVEGGADLPASAAEPTPVSAGADPGSHDAPAEPVGGIEAELEGTGGRAPMSNGALVVLGVFGGLYLLYTWGWFVVAQAYSAVNAITAAGSGSIGGVLQQIVFWAAPLAPALWFIAAVIGSRGGRTRRLAVLLCVGAVLLLPLPMLIARGG